jgi:hypothetical protein
MKHIKTWRSLNALFEAFKTEDYYQEINHQEYVDLLGTYVEWSDEDEESLRRRVTDSDLNKLKKLFSDRPVLPYRVDDDGFKDESGDGVYVDGSYVDTESVNIWIDSLEDDWYLVSTPCGYYKCDQWDGLIRLLSDKGYLNSPKPEPEKKPENYEEILNRLKPIQEAFSEDDYYKEISIHDYAQAEVISFSISLEYKIKFRLEPGYEIERRGSHMGVTIYNDEPTTDGLWHGDWSIYLMEDEWFLVETEFSEGDVTFFKCDQWDGLMRLLKRYKVVS